MKKEYLLNEEFRKVKTFMQGMVFGLSLEEKQTFLADKRLTQVEKKIIEAYIKLRDCRYDEIIQTLSEIKTSNALIEAQRRLVLGITYIDSGNLREPESHLRAAIKTFQEAQLESYEFHAQVCLCIHFANRKEPSAMPAILDRMNEIKGTSVEDQVSYLRCVLHFHLMSDDLVRARPVLAKLHKLKDKMVSSQLFAYLMDRFNFFVKCEDFKSCYEVLEEIKGIRKFYDTLSFKYMRALLDNITTKAPIYLQARDFADSPQIWLGLQIIKGLEEMDMKSVLSAWKELQTMNPQVFGEFPDYKGDKGLFSLALKNAVRPSTPVIHVKGKLGEIENTILTLLLESPLPVSKEVLVEKIWGRPYEGEGDFKRLSMVISRIKKKTAVNIVSRKGTYFILTDDKKVS